MDTLSTSTGTLSLLARRWAKYPALPSTRRAQCTSTLAAGPSGGASRPFVARERTTSLATTFGWVVVSWSLELLLQSRLRLRRTAEPPMSTGATNLAGLQGSKSSRHLGEVQNPTTLERQTLSLQTVELWFAVPTADLDRIVATKVLCTSTTGLVNASHSFRSCHPWMARPRTASVIEWASKTTSWPSQRGLWTERPRIPAHFMSTDLKMANGGR
mmetsp:Transcript_4357/g.13176  ORF Transcript_4357/g.13176 Transcript_4357/m.13176 type:complete len:215 (-) Transcript_4357:583-1227(-)